MATIVNDRDVLIMSAPQRYSLPTDRGMFLTPSTAVFKMASNGLTASPSSFTFAVTLLNMTGAVSWSWTGGMSLSVNGNTATLDLANFSAVSGTVTATITVDGQVWTATATVTKVADGAAGPATYTWVKYADSSAGAGLSDDPTGKAYIGLAYNKTTATESTTASDYAWSLIKGTDGQPGAKGADGITLYTWVKYSDNADGTGLYDTPSASTLYIGIAVNKTSATESTVKTDYVWSKFRGDQGIPGTTGPQGVRGNVDIAAVTSSSVWSDSEAVAALAAAGWGQPQTRDMVKLYKADRSWCTQKMYNGNAWVTVDYVYDGNLFIKGSILPESIDTRGLDIKDPLGNITFRAGKPIADQIGIGPNLVENPRSWTLSGGATRSENNAAVADGVILTVPVNAYATSRTLVLAPNTDYTLSFKAIASTNGAKFSMDLFPDTLPETQFTLTNTWENYSVKWNSSNASMAAAVLRVLGGTTSQIQIGEIKLEKGAKKTPYSDSVITPDNAATFIALAAIKLAQMDKASIGSLSALSAVIGLLRTATSGQRSELSDSGLQLFNSSNVPVIQVGFF